MIGSSGGAWFGSSGLVIAALAACVPGRADDRGHVAPPIAPAAPPVAAPGDAAAPDAAHPDAAPSCVTDGAPYDQGALAARIAFLASAQLGGRVPGSDGDRAARAHIAARMACLGLTVIEQRFTDSAGQPTANVIGYVAGHDPKVGGDIILVGAHHDHLGNGLLGANDDASGVAALLAIAQAVRQQPHAPRRTLAFAAFGAEEQGMVGSEHFAANPPAALPVGRVVQFVNLDMVGSYKSKRYVAAMGTFHGLPATAIMHKLSGQHRTLRVGLGGRASRSDHLPFCTRGIPYVFFWTPDATCYHETCDTADRIDVPRLADIAALAGELVWSLAQSHRDLADARARLGCQPKR